MFGKKEEQEVAVQFKQSDGNRMVTISLESEQPIGVMITIECLRDLISTMISQVEKDLSRIKESVK